MWNVQIVYVIIIIILFSFQFAFSLSFYRLLSLCLFLSFSVANLKRIKNLVLRSIDNTCEGERETNEIHINEQRDRDREVDRER